MEYYKDRKILTFEYKEPNGNRTIVCNIGQEGEKTRRRPGWRLNNTDRRK